MFHKLKYLFIGVPLPSQMMSEKRLNKVRALAAFSPDALSSLAYANQEIFLGLVIAGSAGLSLQFPIALAITILLCIVALSYSQTMTVYNFEPSLKGMDIPVKLIRLVNQTIEL